MKGNLSELEIIDLVRHQSVYDNSLLIKGIGDDCAVFGSSKKGEWLVTTDTLVDQVHFDTGFHPPYLLGRKSVAVSLSDIAAMGGVPRFLLISVSITPRTSESWLTGLFDGILSISSEYGCCLIGGDTVQASELSITATLIGEAGDGGIIYRDGARWKDSVYVSGFLGESAAGLGLLQKGIADPENSDWAELIGSHLNPIPRVELGQQLALSQAVTAMQDISDGLATDLGHICQESNVRAEVEEASIPLNPKVVNAAELLGKEVIELQLFSGEDYQLVFTVKNGQEKFIEDFISENIKIPIYKIGKIEKGSGVHLKRKRGEMMDITYKGYEHRMR